MQVYVFDKKDLSIKQVATPIKSNGYRINLDEETNGKSQFVFQKKVEIIRGDFLFFNSYLFLVEVAEDEKGSNLISVTCKDAINIFDRKIIQTKTEMMLENSLEEFLAAMIMDNFVQNDDPVINIPYIDIAIESQTKVTEPTNSENLIYNFRTFMVNCRQNKDIFTELTIEQGDTNRLHIYIRNIVDEQVLIDTTVSEVTGYLKQYEVDPVAKVQCFIRDVEEIKYLFLKSDNTTTDNIDNPMRITGRVETISIDTDEEGEAYQEMLNVFRGNRFKHLVEFKIKKSSKLVDVSKLKIGTPVKIKTKGIDIFDIYDSYISAISFDDNEFISYKSGQLRVSLTDKLQQGQSRSIGNKLDITGGSVRRLNVDDGITQNGNQIIDYEVIDTNTRIIQLKNGGGSLYPKTLSEEVVLYNNSAGTRATVTLSESAANFEYIEIYFMDNNAAHHSSMKIFSPNGKRVDLALIEASSNSTYIRRTRYQISGTSLTPTISNGGGYFLATNSSVSFSGLGTNYIFVYRVVGYR